MPRYTTSQTYTDGNTQIVALPDSSSAPAADNMQLAVAAPDPSAASSAKPESEELEVKLRRILEHVPVRISNTSGSSAGSGSGDFHQYRQMRRREQDRLARMEADHKKRKEEAEFLARREERLKVAEERTAKRRAKRQKKKQKRLRRSNPSSVGGEGHDRQTVNEGGEGSSSEDEDGGGVEARTVGDENRGVQLDSN